MTNSKNYLFVGAYHFIAEDIVEFLNDFDKYIGRRVINFDIIFIFNVDGLYIFSENTYKCIKIEERNL